jgi:hypothetical protein
MKRLSFFLFVLGFVSFIPKSMRADAKITCIDSSTCPYPCYSIEWIQYTDPDGTTTGQFGDCCECV